MTVPTWFWKLAGALALLIIVAAGLYLWREPGKSSFEPVELRTTDAASPPAVEPGRPAASPVTGTPVPAPTPGSRVVLRGAEPAPKLNLVEAVTRLKQETAADAPKLTSAVAALVSTRAEDRAEAVDALGFSEDVRFIAPIVHLLHNDPEAEVRAAAASALELYRGWEVAAALGQALADPNEDVRAHALLSLKVQRDNHVERELQAQLKNGDLDEKTALEVRLFLDHHYVRKDPFKDPVAP